MKEIINTKKMIRRFYAFEGLSSAFFYLPVFVIYLSGILSPVQVSILISLKEIATLIFEIPTGFFADRISRKASIQIGAILTIGSLIIFLCRDSFLWLAGAQIVFGIAETFLSGSDVSWLYDNLHYLKQDALYEKVNQRVFQARYAILILSYSIGGWLFKMDEKLPFAASALCLVLSLIFCSSIMEAPYKKADDQKTGNIGTTLAVLKTQPADLWKTICIGNLVMGGMNAAYVYLLPLILEKSMLPSTIGLSYSFAMLFTLFISDFSHRIRNKSSFLFRSGPALFTLVCLVCVLFPDRPIVGVTYLVVLRSICGVSDIIYTAFLNRQIEDSAVRATLISVGNSILNGSSAVLTIICGILAEFLGLSGTLLFIGGFTLVLSFAYGMLSGKNESY